MHAIDDLLAGKQNSGTRAAPTRDRLIRAFTDLVQQRGYAAVGTAEVLKVASAPRGSLYHHFPSGKSGLAVAAVEYMAEAVTDALHRATTGRRTLPVLLRGMASARAAWLKRTGWSEGPLLTVLSNEVVPHEPDIAEALKVTSAAINSAFTDLFMARGFAPDTARRNAHMTRSLLDGAMTLSRAARSTDALLEAGDFLATRLADSANTGA